MKKEGKDFLMLTVGALLVAAGVYFFKFPNNFSTGGVSGLSLIIGRMTGIATPGTWMLGINLCLLVAGFFLLDRKVVSGRIAYASLLMSGAVWILERVYPLHAPLTSQPLLELIFGVMLPSVGSAILFNINASTGGTDIVAMILERYTNVDIGKRLFLSDFLITIAALVCFGPTAGLYSILGLLMKSVVVDSVIENFHQSKSFTVVTKKPQEVKNFILNELHAGATSYEAEGGYTHEHKTIILTVLHRRDAVRLKQFVKEIDPKAFLLITTTSETIGKGFRGFS